MTNETPRYDTDDDSVVEADVDNASVQTGEATIAEYLTESGTTYAVAADQFDQNSDTDGLQEAIADVASNGGGMVLLGPKQYNVSPGAVIELDTASASNVTLQGAGRGATTIVCAGTDTYGFKNINTNISNFGIRDMRIQPQTVGDVSEGAYLENAQDCFFKNVTFDSFGSHSFRLVGDERACTRNFFRGCKFGGTNGGTDTAACRLSGDTGDDVKGVSNINTFVECVFFESEIGLWIQRGADNNIIASNFVANTGRGCDIHWYSNNIFGGSVESNTLDGIRLLDTGDATNTARRCSVIATHNGGSNGNYIVDDSFDGSNGLNLVLTPDITTGSGLSTNVIPDGQFV